MTVGIGFTAEEIREFVHDYEVQPFGTKLAWLSGSGVSYERLRNWRSAVFEGDSFISPAPLALHSEST